MRFFPPVIHVPLAVLMILYTGEALKKNMHQGRHQEYTQMIAKAFAVRETQLVKCFAVPGISLEHTKQNKIFSFNNLAVEGFVHGLESAGSSEM